MTRAPIAVVLKGYPRLSETFIAEELLGLERLGFDLRLVALRHPTDPTVHPVHRAIRAPVSYLPEYLHREPWRVLKAWWRLRGAPGLGRTRRRFRADLRRDPTRNRVRRFGQALVLAAELPPEVRSLHAHFIHTPASVTAYAAAILDLPWTCSAHAKDIWTSPDWDLADKLQHARWTVTCTQAGRARLQGLTAKPVHLAYHGLKLDRFVPLPGFRSPRDGRSGTEPVRLLSVGRAVEKKGFDLLVEALARLPPDLSWTWTHLGAGPMMPTLGAAVDQRNLADRVTFMGARDQAAVLDEYRRADLFVLPCRVAPDGDRDGLPNVLVEAQSQALACLSTDVGGVAELIRAEATGVLVPPDDPDRLAAALERLIRDPDLRLRLGKAGARRVAEAFDARLGLATLADLFNGTGSPTSRLRRSEAG